MKIGVLNIPAPDDHLSSLTPTPDFVDRGHLDRENDILGRQVLDKNLSCYEDMNIPALTLCGWGHLDGENAILMRQVLNKLMIQ